MGGEDVKMTMDVNANKVEEDFTVARLYLSKMKSEVKNLVQRCQSFEFTQIDTNKKLTEYERDLSDCRLLISQHEARMKSLQESMREAENKKRGLEDDLDALREEYAKLKVAEQVSTAGIEEKQEAAKLRQAFEEQTDHLRDVHQKQIAALRDDISEKQECINELKL